MRQRRTVAGGHRVQGAVVDGDVDLAVVGAVADGQAHERLRLALAADRNVVFSACALEGAREFVHCARVIRADEVVKVASGPVEQPVGGQARAAGEREPACLGQPGD